MALSRATLAYHPLANLFPLIEGEAFDELVADVRANGVREPVVLLDGKILDGRNRWRAGLEAGFFSIADDGPRPAAMFVRFDRAHEGQEPLAWVVSKNLRRRHLTDDQRRMVAARIATLKPGKQPEANGTNGPISRRDAATLLSVDEKGVGRARTVVTKGADELQQAVDQRRVTVRMAADLAALPKEAQREIVALADPKAIKDAAKKIRAVEQQASHKRRLKLAATKAAGAAPLPAEKKYAVIYADPPWLFASHSDVTGREKSPENHYPTMPLEKILALGCPAAPMAALFLWGTAAMTPEALAVMAAWGFSYRSHWIWHKQYPGRRTGTGYWSFTCHELLFIGVRGGFPAPLPGTQPNSVFSLPVGRHSEKPHEFAQTIERLYPDVPKLEMFCRAPRPGWDVWGFESAGAAA